MNILLPVVGSIIGQIFHLVNKRVMETGEGEGSVFKRWILCRPISTLVSTAGGATAAIGGSMVTVPTESAGEYGWVVILAQSILTGIAANEIANRPGNG